MFLDYGYRSKCCYAAIRMGRKKIKNTKLHKNVWVCVNCGKKDVDIVDYSTNSSSESNEDKLDNQDPDVLE